MEFALWLENQAQSPGESLDELLVDIIYFFGIQDKWGKTIERIDKGAVDIDRVHQAEAAWDQMTMIINNDTANTPANNLDQIPILIKKTFNYLHPYMPRQLFDEAKSILISIRQDRIERIFQAINGLGDMFDLPPRPDIKEKFRKFAEWTNRSQFWEVSEFQVSKIESIILSVENGRSPTTSLFAIKKYYLPKVFSVYGSELYIVDFFDDVIKAYKDFKAQEFKLGW